MAAQQNCKLSHFLLIIYFKYHNYKIVIIEIAIINIFFLILNSFEIF